VIPACPKCGCPARIIVVIKGHVRCVLESDGTPGKVLSASKDQATALAYECGGGHTFTIADEFQRAPLK